MIQTFLWETYSAHSDWIVTIALGIFGIIFICGALYLAMRIDAEISNSDDP